MDVPNILVAFGNFIEGLKILGNKNRINPSHFNCVGKVEMILKAQQKICIDHVKYCKVLLERPRAATKIDMSIYLHAHAYNHIAMLYIYIIYVYTCCTR